jgi:mercuric ion transport protein
MSDTVQQTNAMTEGRARQIEIVSQVGLIAGIAALVGASCCALPLVLASLGVAGAWIANLEIFVVYRPYVTAFAIIVIGLGWVIAARRHAPPRTLVVLGLASVIVGAALLIVQYETELARYLIALRRK